MGIKKIKSLSLLISLDKILLGLNGDLMGRLKRSTSTLLNDSL